MSAAQVHIIVVVSLIKLRQIWSDREHGHLCVSFLLNSSLNDLLHPPTLHRHPHRPLPTLPTSPWIFTFALLLLSPVTVTLTLHQPMCDSSCVTCWLFLPQQSIIMHHSPPQLPLLSLSLSPCAAAFLTGNDTFFSVSVCVCGLCVVYNYHTFPASVDSFQSHYSLS